MTRCPWLLLLAVGAAAGTTLIETDFGAADQPPGGHPERVTGQLPAGWRDDSGWCPAELSYQPMEEEGRHYLRVEVTSLPSGRGQMAHVEDLPPLTGETFFRLTLTARSTRASGLELGLRDRGVPYQWAWVTRPALGGSWQDYRYDFRLTEHPRALGFYICLDDLAQVDLARLRLDRLTRDEYAAELLAAYPDGGPPNLLRHSRFPLGLPDGWALDRDNSDGDQVQVTPDPARVGPSGFPALRVTTSERTWLRSEPFAVPLAFSPHTASVAVAGRGNLRLVVALDGRERASATFALTDAFQRCAVRFDPVFLTSAYSLRLEFDQTIWLDACQVNEGTEPTAYRPQRTCEVALQTPDSPTATARVQFLDEPAAVDWVVTGPAPGARLRGQVTDAYGETWELPAVTLGEAMAPAGQWDLSPRPSRPIGGLRVQSWVEAADGERLSPTAETVVYRLRRPHYWGQDHLGSRFGVHTNPTTRHLRMAKAVGINWVRLHDAGLPYIGWYHLERKRGEWTFYDREIHRYRREHLAILGELGTAPEWASYFDKPRNGYFDRFYQPRDLADYANYVEVVTRRYQGVIHAWDVWNEPWIHAWWGVGFDESKPDRAGYLTSERPQEDFAAMMRVAYQTAKAVDPELVICGFNTTTSPSGSETRFGGTEWTQGVLAAGGLDQCDTVVYHHYAGGHMLHPDDAVARGLEAAVGPIREALGAVPKPVWMTEGSSARDTIAEGLYEATVPYPNSENVWRTSDRLSRYMVSLLAHGVERMFLYTMHGHSTFANRGGDWRVLITPEGALHPSAVAHAQVAWQLEDTRPAGHFSPRERLHVYLFAGDGRSVAVLAPDQNCPDYPVPSGDGITATDQFGNPLPAGARLDGHLIYLEVNGNPEPLREVWR